MTAPIQEPSTDRALQGFAYQRDQLLRRPAPPSEGESCSYARAWLPTADSYELLNPTVSKPIIFTHMMTNAPSIFEKYVNVSQADDSAIFVKEPGLYRAECKVEYVFDGMALHQTRQAIRDQGGTDEIFLISSGQHGANTGVVTGEDPQDESTTWGYDTRTAVWLVTPSTDAIFFIDVNVIDGGAFGVYINQAWMWILHVPLSSLTETDIF